MQRPFPNGHKFPFGCNVQRLCNGRGRWPKPTVIIYSGVGIFNWYYLSSPPQIPLLLRVGLELGGPVYSAGTITEFRGINTRYAMAVRSTLTNNYKTAPGDALNSKMVYCTGITYITCMY